MKKQIRTLTLIFGVIIAIFALTNSKTYAKNMDRTSIEEITTVEQEVMQEIRDNLKLIEQDTDCEKRIQIFNSENQLIYECRGRDDQRLDLLLRRSDLIFQTDSSSYYLLGD